MNRILKHSIRSFSSGELLSASSAFGTSITTVFGILAGFYLVDSKIETKSNVLNDKIEMKANLLSDKIDKLNDKIISNDMHINEIKNILTNIQGKLK